MLCFLVVSVVLVSYDGDLVALVCPGLFSCPAFPAQPEFLLFLRVLQDRESQSERHLGLIIAPRAVSSATSSMCIMS